jgi:DNA-binding transcriptional LysR family regulator
VRGPQRPLRSVEEKLEHVAAGHGIIVLPLSATQYYGRPDIVYVPVVDAELDQVYLACEAARRSKLIADFIRLAKSLYTDDQTLTTARPPEMRRSNEDRQRSAQ